MNEFNVFIGIATYRQGLINPGIAVDNMFGVHGSPVNTTLPNGTILNSTINRTHNPNGGVRIYFGVQFRECIQNNYNLNDNFLATVPNHNSIVIL
ncbi:hypothetical protein [uncultured Arcticibacterium sp.]|uniref:hypothetical protein n=1 Tax=uncultured Arcticibacterium sp. TaxID=2173042 RepID=UPI0030F9D509